jgi:RimJ/RimL family protein N-acetyltransferase
MLGPYWTNILFRGQGYYGRLLKQSIALAGNDCPLFIYTAPENISSQKGIEKIGFNKIGIFKITLILRYFRWYEQIDKK